MKYNARGVCGFSANKLLMIATKNGTRALGLEGKCGELATGQWCDFVSIDMTAKELSGLDKTTLLDGLVFGSGNSAIAGTCVGGQIVYSKQVRSCDC
jgi:cytosine/adenosine deaminase-related metal-dependent hydrolase